MPPRSLDEMRALAEERMAAHGVELKDIHLIPRHFYSPVAEVETIPEAFWRRKSQLHGIQMDTGRQIAFLDSTLGRFITEFSPPEHPSGEGPFMENGFYESVDAEVLYAMVRWLKPSRIIEFGSGFSSLLIANACQANRREGETARFTIVDPWPSPLLSAADSEVTDVLAAPAQTISSGELTALRANDIVFIDTSHTVKLGGEVNFFVLEVLPMLAPGVITHFHDIFLPWEYPRAWLEAGRFFSEQYLLQAYLSANPDYEILFASYAVAREHPERLASRVSSFAAIAGCDPGRTTMCRLAPTAFWVRRRCRSAAAYDGR